MYVPDMPVKSKRTTSSTVNDLIVAALAVASFALSGWSLATLLTSAGAPKAVAIFGVGVFDGLALLAALQVYERRHEPYKAFGARLVMMLALLASSIVNAAHGQDMGGWTTAVVLGAAPLAFEIAFELRHRSMTGLIWVLFYKEAKAALDRDVWVRIAPATEPPTGPADLYQVIREDDRRTESAAVSAAPADNAPAVSAVSAAPAELTAAVRPDNDDHRPAVGNPLFKAPADGPLVRPDMDDVREDLARERVLSSLGLPTETPDVPAPADKSADNPAALVKASTVAGAVRELKAQGVQDVATLIATVPAVLGKPVSAETVKREFRRQVPKTPAPAGTGQYL
ncbi:DUF2637 domain-containing protein [Streptomyces mirabilis]|uniref:DUF2637 domain-containing protein n=1 Tax=Streptomyces mirabilis TaxID=68239 RepID=UPI00224CFE8C|nr:DUF2637 domain-containing protein [Streptomyces mirabilis]MCX4429441.1 DUF2637 domain-containing protein [Streptomyces mirabilis]